MPYYSNSINTGWVSGSTDTSNATNEWRAYSNRVQRVRVNWGTHVVQVIQEYEEKKNNKYKNPDWEV